MDIPLSSRLSSLHLFTGHADELRSNPYSHLPSRGAVDDDEDRNGIISNESNRVQGDEGSDKEHGQEQFKRLLILRLHESCTSCFRCCRGSIDIFTALIRSISAEFTHDESNIELNRRRVSRNTAHSDESSEAHLEPSDDDRNADSALIAAYEEDMRIMKDELNQLRDDFVRAREEDKERARLEKDQAVAATAAAAMAAARNISQKPASSNNWF